ncbi:MAG: SGNH/GDSL hydrolase family protein [Candidatus Binatia bacterium]
MTETLTTSIALLAGPITLGGILGLGVRHLRKQRLRGFIAALGCLFVPAVVLVGLSTRFPVVGLWDAALEGLLVGTGVLWSAHRTLAEPSNVLVLVAASITGLLTLELLSRLFLPPAPGFPMNGGPHLLLADALRGDSTHQPWDTLSKDIVCSIVYGEQYPGIFDLSRSSNDIVTPHGFAPRPNASRRVLHLGDSMAFGFGLERRLTFTAHLERLEPGVQHINAAIPGTAPDAYLAVLQSWIATQHVDLVVMHVYEGNDLDGLDSRFPCCDWESLLSYGAAGAVLRCPQATALDLGHAGFTWLRYHNPPPYLVRALIGTSSAAAYVGAAMTLEPYFLFEQPLSARLDHLESIFRAARDLLAPRRIRFVVDVVPTRSWLETLATWQHFAPQIVAVAKRAGVEVIDGSDIFRDAATHGQDLFFENGDIHFNASGHALWAKWLHSTLGVSGGVHEWP